MMKMFVALVVVLSLSVSASAQTITSSAVSAAQRATRPPPDPNKPPRQNERLYDVGVLSAAGGAILLAWGIKMPAHNVSCGFAAFGIVSCYEEGKNKNLFMAMGAGFLVGGAAMAAVGGKRVTVAPTLGGFRVSSSLTF